MTRFESVCCGLAVLIVCVLGVGAPVAAVSWMVLDFDKSVQVERVEDGCE